MRDIKSAALFLLYISIIFADNCHEISRLQNNCCEFPHHLNISFGACGVNFSSYEDAFELPRILFEAKPDQKYIFFMVDADASDGRNPSRVYRHWAVSDLTGDALQDGKMNMRGTSLSSYEPPDPPPNSGFHCYQLYLFEQHDFFRLNHIAAARSNWSFVTFLQASDFCGSLVATYQFETEKESPYNMEEGFSNTQGVSGCTKAQISCCYLLLSFVLFKLLIILNCNVKILLLK